MSNGLKLRHPQIMSRVLNKPLLLESGYSRVFVNAIAKSSDVDVTFMDGKGAMLPVQGESERKAKSYQVVDGVAMLPVSGTLVHKYGHMQPYSGMTGYDGIEARVREADADPSVETIMLDIDSPGGEVSGCRALADYLATVDTPIVAYVDEMACSAAYWIASACSLIVAPDTANIGSIGVVWMHADYSGKMDKEGIDVTFIHAGRHKVDGNPYQGLAAETISAFQAEIDNLYSMFVESVAKGRTSMSETSIRNTEARVYLSRQAQEMGLIDGVMSKSAFVEFLTGFDHSASNLSNQAEAIFTLQNTSANFGERNSKVSDMKKDVAVKSDSFTQADIDAAKAEAANQAREAAISEYKDEIKAAAARTAKIYSHDSAPKGMKDLLASDAFASVDADSIISLMDMTPKSFSQVMDEEQGAQVQAEPTGMLNGQEITQANATAAAAEALASSKTSII